MSAPTTRQKRTKGVDEMAKKDEKILRVVRIGNSIGVILPKKEYEFRDIEPKDWVKIEFKGVVR